MLAYCCIFSLSPRPEAALKGGVGEGELEGELEGEGEGGCCTPNLVSVGTTMVCCGGKK